MAAVRRGGTAARWEVTMMDRAGRRTGGRRGWAAVRDVTCSLGRSLVADLTTDQRRRRSVRSTLADVLSIRPSNDLPPA